VEFWSEKLLADGQIPALVDAIEQIAVSRGRSRIANRTQPRLEVHRHEVEVSFVIGGERTEFESGNILPVKGGLVPEEIGYPGVEGSSQRAVWISLRDRIGECCHKRPLEALR